MLPLLPLLQFVRAPGLDDVSLFLPAVAATFYATACARPRRKTLSYAAAVFADAALLLTGSRLRSRLAEPPQFQPVPVGLSAIRFAEVNREPGRATINAIRSVGLIIIHGSSAMPIWPFESLGAWLTPLLAPLLGAFLGIGSRLQTNLWLGPTTFVLDVVSEMGRVSLDHAPAKWGIMLDHGLSLVLFVAPDEKRRILSQIFDYDAHVRTWEGSPRCHTIPCRGRIARAQHRRLLDDPRIGLERLHPPAPGRVRVAQVIRKPARESDLRTVMNGGRARVRERSPPVPTARAIGASQRRSRP